MKLIDQYETMQAVIKNLANDIAATFFGKVPEIVYEVGGKATDYAPEAWTVDGVTPPFIAGSYFNKKPTRQTIEALRNAPDMTPGTVRLSLSSMAAHGKISKSVPIADVGSKFWLSPDEPAKKGQERREFYTLKPGQFRCAQCGKATDLSAKVTRRVIARQYPGFGKEFDHCSAQCATHNQFAHEG